MAKPFYKPQKEKIVSEPKDSNGYGYVKDALISLFSRKYWKPTLEAFNKKLQKLIESGFDNKKALVTILDYLTEVLKKSEPEVMNLIKKSGKDVKQSRVAVAGNNFQALVAHTLLKNVEFGNLPRLQIVLKPKGHPLIERYGVIKIGNEEQKPDMDVLIYQDKPNTPIVICSCKTSLRERAGQTYKWKLLLDLATADPKHLQSNPDCPINKYKIEYSSDRPIFVIMITADLYNEINQPQQKGTLAFFNKAFVTDRSNKKFHSHVEPMSQIIFYLNSIYSD